MKSYVYTNISPSLRSVPLVETTFHDFNNIPTADNSQPPIFSTDTIAGKLIWGSNDDNSATDYNEVYYDNDYSTNQLSHSCQAVNQAEGRMPFFKPSALLEDQSLDDTDYVNLSSKHLQNPPMILGHTYQTARQTNDCTILPTKIHTSPPVKCTSNFF